VYIFASHSSVHFTKKAVLSAGIFLVLRKSRNFLLFRKPFVGLPTTSIGSLLMNNYARKHSKVCVGWNLEDAWYG
jgi:hypothetical protein